MRRAVLAPAAGAVMEPSGADSASSYHRLRVVDGATHPAWPSTRATAAPTVWLSVGSPTTTSACKWGFR